MAHPSPEPLIFKPGDPFLGYLYDIQSFLGAGASGQVYLVRHRYTHDRFALKVGHLVDHRSAGEVARNLAEAQAVYRIHHRNVVRVIDLACERDGMVWQIMELLEGISVGALLARCGRFSPLYAIDVAIEIAWGLHEAHEHQIIHRDVHPANVFLTTRGEVKVIDFYWAKVIPAGLQTTRDNRARGTLAYMAPEQLRKGEANPQFDVFALGTMTWQMLTGRLPLEGGSDNTMDRVRRQLEEDPASLVEAAGLPAYFDDVIRGATAKDPRRRYQGMWPLAQALRTLRARFAGDAGARRAHPQASWERRYPIVPDPDGHQQYRPPRSLPRESPEPQLPSRRIVVSPPAAPVKIEAPARPLAEPTQPSRAVASPPARAPAATVPMAVYEERGPVEVSAATVRGGARPRARGMTVVLVVAAGMAALGAALLSWVVIPRAEPGGQAPSSSSATTGGEAPRAPLAPPARTPPARPKR